MLDTHTNTYDKTCIFSMYFNDSLWILFTLHELNQNHKILRSCTDHLKSKNFIMKFRIFFSLFLKYDMHRENKSPVNDKQSATQHWSTMIQLLREMHHLKENVLNDHYWLYIRLGVFRTGSIRRSSRTLFIMSWISNAIFPLWNNFSPFNRYYSFTNNKLDYQLFS